jgi:hypothetical protein
VVFFCKDTNKGGKNQKKNTLFFCFPNDISFSIAKGKKHGMFYDLALFI